MLVLSQYYIFESYKTNIYREGVILFTYSYTMKHKVDRVQGFLSSRPNGVAHPLTRKLVLPPPFNGGGGHTCMRERGYADPIRTRV